MRIALITGEKPCLSSVQMWTGRVCSAPLTKKVTITSSNETVNPSSAAAIREVRIDGKVTWRNVRIGPAPRSLDACSSVGSSARRRWATTNKTIGVMKVT